MKQLRFSFLVGLYPGGHQAPWLADGGTELLHRALQSCPCPNQ